MPFEIDIRSTCKMRSSEFLQKPSLANLPRTTENQRLSRRTSSPFFKFIDKEAFHLRVLYHLFWLKSIGLSSRFWSFPRRLFIENWSFPRRLSSESSTNSLFQPSFAIIRTQRDFPRDSMGLSPGRHFSTCSGGTISGFRSARSSQFTTDVRRMSCGSDGSSSTSWKV